MSNKRKLAFQILVNEGTHRSRHTGIVMIPTLKSLPTVCYSKSRSVQPLSKVFKSFLCRLMIWVLIPFIFVFIGSLLGHYLPSFVQSGRRPIIVLLRSKNTTEVAQLVGEGFISRHLIPPNEIKGQLSINSLLEIIVNLSTG